MPIDSGMDTRTAAANGLRLNALRSYRILDTPIDSAFQDIVKLATFVCNKPIGLVSLVDEKRQWFKAEMGLGERETPIETSVCAHAMLGAGVFEVPDLSQDYRFADNALVTAPNGIRFYAGAPLISPEGFPLGSLCVIDRKPGKLSGKQRDMLVALARQAMAQLELRRTLASASIANRYRSRLMAVAGHDLKQPLQVATMLLEGALLTANAANQKRIERSMDALSQIGIGLDRLAQDSRIGDELTQPRIRVFPISMLLKALAGNWQQHATAQGIDFAVVESALLVKTDPDMLATIVGNLIGNAIKFTRQGSVRVECGEDPDGISLRVIDTGMGIAEKRLAGLFEAFHQEDVRVDGLGLGLSIVQRTADILGISVRVMSTVGIGSTFAVIVPTATTDSQTEGQRAVCSADDLGNANERT